MCCAPRRRCSSRGCWTPSRACIRRCRCSIFVPGDRRAGGLEPCSASVPATLGPGAGGLRAVDAVRVLAAPARVPLRARARASARGMHWIIHGIHHEHPNDPLRLVMPPAVSMPLGAVVFGAAVPGLRPTLRPRTGRGLLRGLSGLRHDPLLRAPLPPARARWAGCCASATCATTSRTTRSGFGISAPYWDEVFRTSPRGRRRESRKSGSHSRTQRCRPRAASRLEGRYS